MKYIISTTGKKIAFNIDAKRKLVIDPIVPVSVDDLEYTLLSGRLGNQISIKQMSAPTVATAYTAPAAPATNAPETETPVISGTDDGIV